MAELRSPRTQAIEAGTPVDPSPPYNPMEGAPDAGGVYKELENLSSDTAGPVNPPTPFSNLRSPGGASAPTEPLPEVEPLP
jgi:hypothetical protein